MSAHVCVCVSVRQLLQIFWMFENIVIGIDVKFGMF